MVNSVELSLTQAAQLMGKTRRQLEYLIQTGRLQARKERGRWRIDETALPLSPEQRAASARRAQALRETATEVLDRAVPKTRYSIRDLKAFQAALSLWYDSSPILPADHPARGYLRTTLDQLAIGCHRFDRRHKAAAYSAARDAASLSACALLADGAAQPEWVSRIEDQIIPAIAGLIRRTDRDTPRRRDPDARQP